MTTCKKKGKEVVYVGESARTGQMRGEDHLTDLGTKREGKPLWQHTDEEHGGVAREEDFKMKVLNKFKTPLERQIAEALEIETRSWTADLLLNKKGEWNGVKIPRLRIESHDNTEEGNITDSSDKEREERKSRIQRMKNNWKKTAANKRKVIEEDNDSKSDQSVSENLNVRKKMRRHKPPDPDNVEEDPHRHTEMCLKGDNIYNDCFIVDKDEVETENEQGQEDLTSRADSQENLEVREVKDKEKFEYFVEFNRELEESEWPDETLMMEISNQISREERQEEVAKSRRKFWAEEMLWEELWKQVKLRSDLKRWSKQILFEKLGKVLLTRNILYSVVDHSVNQKIEKDRKKIKILICNRKQHE